MAKKCVLFVLTVVLIAGVFSPISFVASAALDTSYDLYIKNNKDGKPEFFFSDSLKQILQNPRLR